MEAPTISLGRVFATAEAPDLRPAFDEPMRSLGLRQPNREWISPRWEPIRTGRCWSDDRSCASSYPDNVVAGDPSAGDPNRSVESCADRRQVIAYLGGPSPELPWDVCRPSRAAGGASVLLGMACWPVTWLTVDVCGMVRLDSYRGIRQEFRDRDQETRSRYLTCAAAWAVVAM
jgi:hypothetical protein